MIINKDFINPVSIASSNHLGMVTDIATNYRRTLPVKFNSSMVGLQKFFLDFLMSKFSINIFFIDVYFDNQVLYDRTKPKYNNGKVTESTVNVTQILKLTEFIAVFKADIDNRYHVVMKCARPGIDDYYGRDRFLFNKFKTAIEREASSFKLVKKIDEIKDDFVSMFAHGNLWAYKNSSLFSCLEVILIQYLPTGSIYDETSKYIANDEKKAYNLFAETFKYLYRLHTNNIVHGDPHVGNIMRKQTGSNELCWIDLERLQKKETYFSDKTWNILKLIDIHTLLNHIMLHYDEKFNSVNMKKFRENLPGKIYKNAFLPSAEYRRGGIIHDNSSCNAMNKIFPADMDEKFISDPNMSTQTFLIHFADPKKLKYFIDMCRRAFMGVPADTVPFPYERYSSYPLPETYTNEISGSGENEVQQTVIRTSQTDKKPEAVQQAAKLVLPLQLDTTLEGKVYPLNLDGKQMYTESEDMLYYFKDGKRFDVIPYDEKNSKWVKNFYLKQLYIKKDGKITSFRIGNNQICFHDVVGNILNVRYFVGTTPQNYYTYDLQYTPPLNLKPLTPAVSNQLSTKSIDLVINGDQYYSQEGTKYQVIYEGGKYILCKEPTRLQDTLIRLPENEYHMIKILDVGKLIYLHDDIPLTAFNILKNRHGLRCMKLTSRGFLHIYIKADELISLIQTYDITRKPASLITKD